jgi:ribonuclease E
MFSNHVTLKSGGYLVINPTEALVSIDVNSGRSTREHNIEDTALRTNLEAAEEIARQLRLRDLAGLIVIDFIDMEEKRNNRAVEKKLNESLKDDRARIQVGRISPFGLLEMSRQRIRTGVLESSSVPCAHCAGTGFVRATPSVALQILRSIEEALVKTATHNLSIRTRTEVAFYILNQKRAHLRDLETRFGVYLTLVPDDDLGGAVNFAIDRGEPAVRAEVRAPVTGVQVDSIAPMDASFEDEEDEEVDGEGEGEAEAEAEEERAEGEEPRERRAERGERPEREGDRDGEGRRRRRRRRRRGGRNGEREEFGNGAPREASGTDEAEEADGEASAADLSEAIPLDPVAAEAVFEDGGSEEHDRRRRRGRRGGRGRDREREPRAERLNGYPEGGSEARAIPIGPPEETPVAPAPQPDDIMALPQAQPAEEPRSEPAEEAPRPAIPEPEPVAVVLTPPDPDRPKRAGWWSKAKAAISGS